MKKTVSIILTLIIILTLSACGSKSTAPESGSAVPASSGAVDVDLTALSSTMIYSEVYNMVTTPSDYIGKTVKMSGQFALYNATDANGEIIPEQTYYACVIADATACCQQGLEFVPQGNPAYPDDFPEIGSEITVTGTFETYYEGENMYCHLVNAKMA